MKKLMVVLMLMLGITIYYDVDTEGGWIFVNNSANDCTILAYPDTNKVIWYTSNGKMITQTYTEFRDKYGETLLKNLLNSQIIITKIPAVKDAPKIQY